MAKKRRPLSPDEPLRHPDHPRPVTRREFIRQGFIGGSAMVTGGSALLNLLLSQNAQAASNLSSDIITLSTDSGCTVGFQGAGKIPFIAFDLAGGANLAGSNVMVGGPGGQNDPLSTQGYSKMGIPGNRVPDGTGAFIDNSLGLLFHTDSALLAGIKSRINSAAGKINGFVIPARSDNDTSNNPHNPMYGIAQIGAKGSLLGLIGSVASDSGGNSMAPAGLIDLTLRPTKISRPSDASGLVDTGNLTAILSQSEAINVMESSIRISHAQIGDNTNVGRMGLDATTRNLLNCGYLGAADNVDKVSGPDAVNPLADTDITNIFASAGGVSSDSEFLKTASVMKLVVNGFAGAGTITMGGFDYHTGDRTTGELRDLRAGICIGACLEYAAIKGVPLMIYVFSDGSLFSNGMIDNSGVTRFGITVPGGKGVWTGDNSSTACSMALVYNPSSQPVAGTNQLGNFKTSGDVNTSARTASGDPIVAANNVTSLVYTVLLNYLALHGEQGNFSSLFPAANLGGAPLDQLIALNQIVSGTISNPI
ncbi:MAG: general secretion pathway protein GspF [Gammaproteobacteria bacterium]|nr:general secretion pathway protein GspF [Gammaproteobacteria bacterium]